MTPEERALRVAIKTQLHVNDPWPEALERQLTERGDDPRNALIRAGLRAAIDRSLLSPAAFEGLTNTQPDSQEAVDRWPAGPWAWVYEGGPLLAA